MQKAMKFVLKLQHVQEYHSQQQNNKLVRDNLTRKQFAERRGSTSDRVTLWLYLLKLPRDTEASTCSEG